MLVEIISFLAISCILLGGAILSFFFYKGRTKTKSDQEDEHEKLLDHVDDASTKTKSDVNYEKLLDHVDDASTVITPKMDFSIFFIVHDDEEEEKMITLALKNSKVSTLFPDLKFTIIKNFDEVYGVYQVGENEEKKQKLDESIYCIQCTSMNKYHDKEKKLWKYTTDLLKYLVEHPQYSIIVFDNPIPALIHMNDKLRRHFLYFLMRLSQGNEQEVDRYDRNMRQLRSFLQWKNKTPTNRETEWLDNLYKVPSPPEPKIIRRQSSVNLDD